MGRVVVLVRLAVLLYGWLWYLLLPVTNGLLLQKHRDRLRYEQEENKKQALADAEKARREQEVKMERSFNRRAARLGFVLGALSLFSLLSLVELTPEHFSSAYSNWLQPLFISGDP